MVSCNFYCFKFSPLAVLVYFMVINFFMYIDRGMVSSVLVQIEDSGDGGLGISDSEAGLLGSIFIVGYIIAAPMFAHFCQYFHPVWLMVIGLLIWCGATMLCGLSYTYWMLVLGRAITGVGEASFCPIAPPYILDVAPKEKKTFWLSLFQIALPVGTALGFILGFQIANAFGDWRWPFRLECLIMLGLICIAVFAYKDPSRMPQKLTNANEQGTSLLANSEVEEQSIPEQKKIPIKQQMKELLSNPLFVCLSLGQASYGFTVGGLGFWAITFVQGYYGVGQQTATLVIGGITLITGVGSALAGSVIADRMLKPYVAAYNEGTINESKLLMYKTEVSMRVVFWSMLIGWIIMIIAAVQPNFYSFALLVLFSEGFIFLGVGPLSMATMSCVEEHLRGQANAS